MLVDDGSSAVALPEVPLLGVLPGTGGLTRLVDKRGVRRDRADVFATTAEGIRGEKAVAWRLADETVRARDFAAVTSGGPTQPSGGPQDGGQRRRPDGRCDTAAGPANGSGVAADGPGPHRESPTAT